MSRTIDETKLRKQLELEAHGRAFGIKRFHDQLIDARQAGTESNTGYGSRALQVALEPVAKAVENFIEQANSGKAGRRHSVLPYFKQVGDSWVIAFIGLRVAINHVSSTPKTTTIAIEIGKQLQDEVRFSRIKDREPKLFAKLLEQTKHFTSQGRISNVIRHTLRKHEIDPEWEDWPQPTRALVGYKVIELIIESTGFFETKTIQIRSNKREEKLVATDLITKFIDKFENRCEILTPLRLPTIIPPKKWDAPTGGGYYDQLLVEVPLVKSRNQEYQKYLETQIDQMRPIYEAVNTLQETPWKINRQVYEVMNAMWEADSEQAKLPPRENSPLPPKPHDIDTNEDSRKEWKHEAALIHEFNAKIKGKRFLISRLLWLARMFLDEEELYFPHQLDNRSRAYTLPSILAPQGSDFARGLLTFAHGKPISKPRSLGLLIIHGTNCWGKAPVRFRGRKVSLSQLPFSERGDWIEENRSNIFRSAETPLEFDWWTQADDPWQFLAFCFEYRALQKYGEEFISTLPVHMDGSNNGLQHFAAMTRDRDLALSVNVVQDTITYEETILLDESKGFNYYFEDGSSVTDDDLETIEVEEAFEYPADLYSQVARLVEGRLTEEIDNRSVNKPFAEQLLKIGIDRSLCKKPIMVIYYGGTKIGVADALESYIISKAISLPGEYNFSKRRELILYLAGQIWESLFEVIGPAGEVMLWLREIAQIANKHKTDLHWVTPAGFPVRQTYRKYKSEYVYTSLGSGTRKKITFASETDQLDTRKQAQAISPNFVHSLDASAMFLTINAAAEAGIYDFTMIHDSYGVLAADAPQFWEILRQAFVDMYEKHDVMEEFRSHVAASLPPGTELPEPPSKGDLDIKEVLRSEHFFS